MRMLVLKPSGWIPVLNLSRGSIMHSVFLSSAWLGFLIWGPLWSEIRLLWPWQGLVLLCHDASIAPCACLLPGPKTICCKLRYGLFRLMCCPRTWCDWVSIHTATLKLPASWPQTPVVTASAWDGEKGAGHWAASERGYLLSPFSDLHALTSSLQREGLEIKNLKIKYLQSPPSVSREYITVTHAAVRCASQARQSVLIAFCSPFKK